LELPCLITEVVIFVQFAPDIWGRRFDSDRQDERLFLVTLNEISEERTDDTVMVEIPNEVQLAADEER